MRRRGALAGGAAALLAATGVGCLNFAEPGSGPGDFRASLLVLDDDPARARLDALFDPGRDAAGGSRHVAEPALRILGVPVRPTGELSDGRLTYDAAWTPDPAALAADSVVLTGPRLEGRESRRAFPLPLVWRSGADTVRPGGDGSLRLPLRGVPDGFERDLSWHLEVRDPARSVELYRASGTGPPPDTLEVPGAAMEGAAEDASLRAVLDLTVRGRENRASLAAGDPALFPAEEAGYVTSFELVVRLGWSIRGT